ncbi:MAG: hypothetical protein ABGY96_16665 [bacterium]|nr:hypothetical protein [Gammaproteobacteria bacterium]
MSRLPLATASVLGQPPRIIIIGLALLIFVSCTTKPAISEPQVEAEPVVATERLIASPPKDWQLIYQLNSGDIRLSDFIPPDETEKEWQTKLSFEAHTQLADSDPISIIMGEIKSKRGMCTHIDHFNLFSGFENNYPTSVRLIQCGENAHSQLGEISLIKAIQGNDFFYIVRFLKNVPVFEKGKAEFTNEEVANWSSFLKRVSLCDDDAADHECSSPEPVEP